MNSPRQTRPWRHRFARQRLAHQRFARQRFARLETLAKRFLSSLAVVAFAVSAASATSTAAAADRPNVVLVMTDDQGYWDTGASGNPHIDTPRMDSLAADGTRLRRYYAAPVCSLTRAGMMTGRYYLRTGLYNTRFGGDSIALGEVTVAELLRDAGYRTGLFGKWHLGKYADYQPQRRGFDEFFGHYHGHIERYQHPNQVFHNGKPADARGYVTDLFTDAAIDFIEASAPDALENDTPFFCALMYNAPHSPFLLDTSHVDQPDGDEQIKKYLDRGLPIREARIYAMVERIDENLGRLLDHLDRLGLRDDTLVIFTGDNGGVSRFWKGGMNGQKASPYEGGVRAPFFARWPAKIPPGGLVDAQTSHVDLLPTLCELANTEPPADRTIDGKSLVSLLKGNGGDRHHRYVYHTWDRYFPNPDRRWGISDDRWKLIGMFAADANVDPAKWRLFDLHDDPGETNNLASKRPDVVKRLRGEFVRWFDDVTDGIDYAPVRIPVGDPHENPVVIEPSWATWHGDQIEYRFDGYDWDTIEGWNAPGDHATWRLDVRTPGTYRVRLRYGCRPVDAGGQIRIRAPEATLTHRVKPTTTADQFERFELGTLDLKQGPQELTAEVVNTPGSELMRLAEIELELERQ